MMRSRILLRVAPVLVGAVLVLPVSASARVKGGGFSAGGGSHSGAVMGHRGNTHSGFSHGFNGFHHRHFNSSPVIIVGPSPFWYASPWYGSPGYSAPPVVYTPPPVYIAPQIVYQAPPPVAYYAPAPTAPPAPPGPRVVEFATGHYELRGDGMGTPYTWVWIPNPPSAPPAAPAPSAQPAAPTTPPAPPPPPAGPDGGAQRPAPTRPARTGPIYRWTDDDGVLNITDDVNKVPERYRIQQINRTHL